jgi:hypothetical protein
MHPSDATLSRVSRELAKRMLCVYKLWKVRTLQYQLHTTQKKRKLAEGEEADEEEKAPHDGKATWIASGPFCWHVLWREWPPGLMSRMPQRRSQSRYRDELLLQSEAAI